METKLKVFIGWSGDVSQRVAILLRSWLPKVIQFVEPWMSEEDIDKGQRWSPVIAAQLRASHFGILCVTPDNAGSIWLSFEAGALSNAPESPLVCPFLHGIKPTDLVGPLSQFQGSTSDLTDTWKLILSINQAAGDAKLRDEILLDAFDVRKDEFKKAMKAIPSTTHREPPTELKRDNRDLLEEVLSIARELRNRVDWASQLQGSLPSSTRFFLSPEESSIVPSGSGMLNSPNSIGVSGSMIGSPDLNTWTPHPSLIVPTPEPFFGTIKLGEA